MKFLSLTLSIATHFLWYSWYFTYLITRALTENLIASLKSHRGNGRKRKRFHFTSNNLKSGKIIKYSLDWNPLIFFHFSNERKIIRMKIVFSLNVSAKCSCKNLSENTCKWIDTFMGHPSIPPPSLPLAKSLERLSCGGNVYPTYSRDLERCHLLYIRELQRQASNKRHQLRLCRSAPRLHYTISNKPEYCILCCHVFSLQQLLKGNET